MTEVKLSIQSREGELYGVLKWAGGALLPEFVHPWLSPLVQRWQVFGLDEWVGTGLDAIPRRTAPTERVFLERVAAYIRRQTTLTTTLQLVEIRDGLRLISTELPGAFSSDPRYRFESGSNLAPRHRTSDRVDGSVATRSWMMEMR